MNRLFALTLGVVVSGSALAQGPAKPAPDAPDPKAIVQKSAEAIRKLKVVSYDLEYKVTGLFTAFMPTISGRIVMGKESSHPTKRFRCNVKIQPPGSSDAVELSAGADGNIFYLIDDKTKTVFADIDPQVFGKFRDTLDFALTREFGMARPFEDVLTGGELRYVRAEKVDGQDCHVLSLKSATQPFTDWYFSQSDHLPRRVRFAYKSPQGEEGAGEATIRNLTVDPKLESDPFALVVPPGYKKTDDFAP